MRGGDDGRQQSARTICTFRWKVLYELRGIFAIAHMRLPTSCLSSFGSD